MSDDNITDIRQVWLDRAMRKSEEHFAIAEQVGEMVQNLVAAGVDPEMLRIAINSGLERGTRLREISKD